jgi:hypothetical protein
MNTSLITTALLGDTRSVSYTKDTTVREGTMHYTGVERRKYQRYEATIPVMIGLINSKTGKTTRARLKGMTTDISMEGLGLELNYPVSEMLPLAAKLMGENKRFDLEFNANQGKAAVRGVGEVRWAHIQPPSVMKMGVLVKEMGDPEKEKWKNLVASQTERLSLYVSRLRGFSKHTLIISLPRLVRDLITSPSSTNYTLPAAFITISLIIYWLVQVRFYHAIIPCGISIAVILLTKSGIFSRHPKPRYEIPRWFLRKFFRRSRADVSRDSPDEGSRTTVAPE